MADENIQIGLDITIKQAALANAKRGLADINKAQDNIKSSTDSLAKSQATLYDKMRQVGNAQREQAQNAQKSVEASKNLEEQYKKEANALNETFRVKEGATGKAGGGGRGGLGEGIGASAGIAGALGSVGLDSTGIGGAVGAVDQLKNSIGQLGGSSMLSIGAIGGVGIALAAASVAFNQFQAEVAKSQQALQSQYDAQRSVMELIASDATVEDAQSRLERLKSVQEIESTILAERQADLENAFNSVGENIPFIGGIIGDFAARIATLLGVFSPIQNEIDKAGKASTAAAAEIAQLEKALAAGKFKPAVQEATKAVEAAVPKLDAQADAMQKIVPAAQQATAGIDNVANAMHQAQDQFGKANADAIRNARMAEVKAVEDAQKNLADTQRKYRDDDFARLRKNLDEDRNALIQHQRSLANITKDAQRAEEDALENFDFLAIRNIRKDQARAQEDAQQALDEQAQDRDQARQDELRELDAQRRIEARERAIGEREAAVDRRRALAQQLADNRTALNEALRSAQAQVNATAQAEQQKLQIIQQGAQAQIQAFQGANSVRQQAQIAGQTFNPFVSAGNNQMLSYAGGAQPQAIYNNTFSINGAQSPQRVGQEIVTSMRRVGG